MSAALTSELPRPIVILVDSTFTTPRTVRSRVAGAIVGLVLGVIAAGMSLASGEPADFTRGIGWLVLILAPVLGFTVGPTALRPGRRSLLRAAAASTVLALPLGALLYATALAFGTYSGMTGAQLSGEVLATAAFGVLVAGIPLGMFIFVVACLAIGVLRLVVRGLAAVGEKVLSTSPSARG